MNILVQSNITKEKLFFVIIKANYYYWLIQFLRPIKLLFVQQTQLSFFVNLSTNPNHIESKNCNINYGKSKSNISDGRGNQEFEIEKKAFTHPNYNSSKNFNNKNNGKMRDIIFNKKFVIKEMLLTNLNHIRSKSFCNNYDKKNSNIRVKINIKKFKTKIS